MPFAIFSIASSAEIALRRLLLAVCLAAAGGEALAADGPRVAIFPPVDRTGHFAPVEQIQQALEFSLLARGFPPLARRELDDFFRRHRVRYAAGITVELATALAAEEGVQGVVLTSVEDWEALDPPRVALTSRWVSADEEPAVTWMHTSAQHGLEQPGAFGLGIVTSIDTLLHRATEELAESLDAFSREPGKERPSHVKRRFRPDSSSVDPEWRTKAGAGPPLRVAVLPFIVDDLRGDVGEMVATQFVRWLLTEQSMRIVEPGVVRAALLEARVIQEDGPSLPQVDALHALLDVDLVVSGRVTNYEAMGSSPGTPLLGFSAWAIDASTRQAVWSAFSSGRGDDRLGAFGTARIRSSIILTSELVHGAVEALRSELASRRPRKEPAREKGNNP